MEWIKIIILSGHDEFDYAKKALECGVIGYVMKPVTSEDFSEILNSFEDNWSHRIPYVCRWCKVDRNRIPAGIQMM